MRFHSLVVVASLLAVPVPAQSPTAAAIDSFVGRQVAADQFSGVVAVVRNGQLLYQRAAGIADREGNRPMTLDTKLQIASMTKFFTHIAIRQLEQAGKIVLSDTVGKYLPTYPNETVRRKATVEHLLRHRSGIGSFWNDRWMATHASVRTVDDYLKLFQNDTLLFAPGTGNAYSNGAYVVLGAIIEKVSGQSYHDYLRDHVFRPAGMTNTTPFDRKASIANAAVGYARQNRAVADSPRRPNSDMQPGVSGPAGDHYSTAGDFLKLAAALSANKLLDPLHTAALLGSNYNTGLDARTNGGGPGVNGEFSMYPNGDVMIVISNYDPPSATTIAQFIRSLLNPGPLAPGTRGAEQVSFAGDRAEIPLTLSDGFYYADVKLNGRPYRFTLETGASFLAVNNRVARDLGFPVDTTRPTDGIVRMRPGMPLPSGKIDSLSIAGVTFRGVDTRVTALFDNMGFDGIISLPLLRDLLWTMDLGRSRLILERGALPAPNGRDVFALAGRDPARRLDFITSIGEVKDYAVIDTRYADWIMTNDSMAAKVRLASPLKIVGSARGPSVGNFEMRGARLDGEVRVGKYAFPRAPVVFRNRGGTIVGAKFLEQFAITVDQRNGRIRFARPDSIVKVPELSWENAAAAAPTAGARSFGFRMAARGSQLFVVMLDTTSAAAKAGLRENDEVVEFDGVAAAAMSPDIFRAALARDRPTKLVVMRSGKRVEIEVVGR
jgi:D-alanyl-D-alanine carboxypeptidase